MRSYLKTLWTNLIYFFNFKKRKNDKKIEDINAILEKAVEERKEKRAAVMLKVANFVSKKRKGKALSKFFKPKQYSDTEILIMVNEKFGTQMQECDLKLNANLKFEAL